jgi:hypothetical protein
MGKRGMTVHECTEWYNCISFYILFVILVLSFIAVVMKPPPNPDTLEEEDALILSRAIVEYNQKLLDAYKSPVPTCATCAFAFVFCVFVFASVVCAK